LTTYRQVKGYSIKSVASDPDNAKVGQVWYNSTELKLKVAPFIESWASGGAYPFAVAGLGGCGTQTAALAYGGNPPSTPPGTLSAVTAEYDGDSWTTGGDLNTARGSFINGHGTQTAGMATGGSKPGTYYANHEHYNGTSWSEQSDLNTAKNQSSQASQGTQTAAVVSGGLNPGAPPGNRLNDTEEWNGSSWSEVADVPVNIAAWAGAGTQTAALGFGGTPLTDNGTTSLEYNGTSWTSSGSLNQSRQGLGGCGSQTAALAFGGENSPYRAETEAYDGTTWSAKPTLANARQNFAPAGTATAALATAGEPASTNTEEFTGGATTRSVDVS